MGTELPLPALLVEPALLLPPLEPATEPPLAREPSSSELPQPVGTVAASKTNRESAENRSRREVDIGNFFNQQEKSGKLR